MDARQALSADVNDIIFENRNKSYGAYQLRKEYTRHLIIGLSTGVALLLLLILMPKIINLLFPEEEMAVVEYVPVSSNKLAAPPRLNENKPPPPPPEITPPVPKTVAFTVPEVKEDVVEKKEDQVKMDDLKDVQIGTANVEGPVDLPAAPGPAPVLPPDPPKKKEALIFVDEMPAFPGDGYEVWLQKNIKYPEYAVTNDIQGIVYLQIVIDDDGTVKEVKLLKGVDKSLNDEAVRVAKQMPKWIPGKQNGQPVPVKMNIPVKFQLR